MMGGLICPYQLEPTLTMPYVEVDLSLFEPPPSRSRMFMEEP